jgi:hypothetical protein
MSYKDYPQSARQKAKSAIERNNRQNNRCATQVGKVRAQQISQGKPLSRSTLERTYSYLSRGKAYVNPGDKNTCGSISYDLWGGDPMLRYTKRKLGK